MTYPHMDAKLNEYVDGTLGVAERAAVEAHLASCAECTEAMAASRWYSVRSGPVADRSRSR